MAAPAGLPDPNTLDVFAYDDVIQDAMVDIVSADNTEARVIQDYVVDPVDWQADNRGNDRGDGTGPPNGVNTVEGILGFDIDDMECFVCNQKGNACSGQDCIDIAKTDFEDVTDSKLIIRQARWGYGVFAWANIQSETLIGEYLGRLMPLDHVSPNNNSYIYAIENHADCDAEIYGNITRYINHHCNCNTEPEMTMYGKRAVMTFKTSRFIRAGEELTIDYGPEYFDEDFPCQCDAFAYPHTSEVYRRRVHPDSTLSPTGIGTYGEAKGKRGGGEASGTGAAGSSVEETWTRKTRAGQAKAKKTLVEKTRVEKTRVGKTRVEKPRLTRMRIPKIIMLSSTKKASAPKVRRRKSWGSRAYKGGDHDWNPLRRSARIAAIGLGA